MSMSVLIDNSSRRKTSRSDKRSRLSCQQRVEGDDEIAASRLAYGGRKSNNPKYDQTTNRNNMIETIDLNDPHNIKISARVKITIACLRQVREIRLIKICLNH